MKALSRAVYLYIYIFISMTEFAYNVPSYYGAEVVGRESTGKVRLMKRTRCEIGAAGKSGWFWGGDGVCVCVWVK